MHKTTVTVDRDALIKTVKFARVVTAEAKERRKIDAEIFNGELKESFERETGMKI